MGAAKHNPLAVTSKGPGRFDLAYQAVAEADLGLHHAIAFERITGWPVHGTYVGEEPIRFHNEDGWMWAFDVRGMMSAVQHGDGVIQPIVTGRQWPRSVANKDGYMEIGCVCLGVDGLIAKGVELRDDMLSQAETAIRANQAYLHLVPSRAEPRFPASALNRYAFGKCVVFAEALSRVRGLPPVAMLPSEEKDWSHISQDQRQHAAVLHPDGELEDVWGKAPARRIADRYAISSWRLSEDAHREMIDDGIAHRPEVITEISEAETLIRAHIQL